MRRLFRVIFGMAAFGAAIVFLERRRPVRAVVERKGRHDLRNLLIGALSGATVFLLETPAVMPLAKRVEQRRWGLVHQLPLSKPVRSLLVLLLMDYTLFLWHWLNHRTRILWRFHAAHHVDLDLNASTALRFHFGEMAVSVPWRAAQVFLIGVGPRELRLWQALTLLEITFHHSNLQLPIQLERLLSFLLVTPRMHGLHHSSNAVEASCNWSSGLSVWDRIHRTYQMSEWQPILGVAGMLNPSDVTLSKTLALPFRPTAAVEEYLEMGKSAERRKP